MTDKPQEPRDLIQICTDIYYECETIKRLDELTDEALDWHNKQTNEAIYEFHRFVMEADIIRQEADQAFNYGRLHRAIDVYIAERKKTKGEYR